MNTQELVKWLLDNGGATIRYRTANELAELNSGIDFDKTAVELTGSQEVKVWLEHLRPANGVNRWGLHGSFNTCFENAMNKLIQLGMHAGMPGLDEATLPFRKWVAENVNTKEEWGVFSFAIVTSFLAMAGYTDDAIMTFLTNRLNVLYDFTSKCSYDIYDDSSKYKGVPKAFRDTPIIKPELYESGNYKFPMIYDVYGLSALKGKCDSVAAAKIENVVSYILTSDYHSVIVHKYGILASIDKKYYSMGWDVRLPGYFGIGEGTFRTGSLLVQRMEMLAHFSSAIEHPWFQDGIRHLETFQTVDGMYAFPMQYLAEKEGYWVSAAHMGLGENRKMMIAKELESTFWMLKIKKLAGLV